MGIILGSVYTDVSEDFQIGLKKNIARTIKAEKHDLGVVEYMGTEIKIIGKMDNSEDGTYDIANRVYDSNAISPCLHTCQQGDTVPLILDAQSVKMIRTEEGRRLRKEYESGEIHHGFNEYREAIPGDDGICNTITTVQKDNQIFELKHKYRIRKLTPRECWRLMGFTDDDFDKAQSVNSNSQLYKQAGNSIVKAVLMAIFSQLNIDGVKPWNDMTEDERNNLVKEHSNYSQS